MFDSYLERITNEAYYNNEPDQRVLEKIEEVKERLEDVVDILRSISSEEGMPEDLHLMSLDEGESSDMEDEILEFLCEKEELEEELEELEEMAYGSY